MPLLQLCLGCWSFTHFSICVCFRCKIHSIWNLQRIKKKCDSLPACAATHCSTETELCRFCSRGAQSRRLNPVFANWGHNESNEINREHKKKLRRKEGAHRGAREHPFTQWKSLEKNLYRKSKSNVSGLWAKVSWRNKSFSQQSQREITEHSIGMHSGRFYVPKGSFLIFWTELGRGKVGAM